MILFQTYAISFIIIIILFYTQADDIPFLLYQQSNYSLLYDIKQFSDGKLMLLTENDPGLQLVFRNGMINPINNFRNLTKNNLAQFLKSNIQLGGITQITTDNTPSIGFLGTFLLNNTINWIKFCISDQNSNTNNQLQIANSIISARMNYSITEMILFNNIDDTCVTNDPIQIYDSVQNYIFDHFYAYNNISCWSGFNYNNTISNICTFPFQYEIANITIFNIWLIAFSLVELCFNHIFLLIEVVYVSDYNAYGLVDPSKSNTYETLELKNISSSYYFENLKNLGVIPNNTAWLFYNDSRNANWSLFVKEMPKINDDTFYENSIIKSTSPNHNMSFQLPTQLNFSINITFTIPIVKSFGNLTIYQSTQIRQKFPINSKYCNISHGTILSCTVFPSTFNSENENYIITVDNNFVKSASNYESLAGIKNIWIVSTSSRSKVYNCNTMFNSRFNSIKLDKNFYDMLQQQLIDSIPLNDKDRLKPIKHINDPTSANKILMEFLITKANSTEYPDVSNIINVLDDLIQNKDTSALVQYNLTKFLDSSYRFKANPSLIQIFLEIKYELLGIGILFIILFVGYLGLKKRNPK
ncbi:43459_t:CDS:2, partial [Gigaspora margarita]